jgi:predicted nucleic acid-binding protein
VLVKFNKILLIPCHEQRIARAQNLSGLTIKMHHTLSYADAFAAAAAQALGATLVSGDPELVQLEGTLALEKLERKG